MNVMEHVKVNDDNNDAYDDGVYGLVTKLSLHILETYRPIQRSVQFTYDHDARIIKRLRTKAFEILLNRGNQHVPNHDYKESDEIDPFLEIEKHIFTLRVGLKHSSDAKELENLVEELEEFPCTDITISPVLRLLLHLRSFNATSDPITNVFYCNKINPMIPEMIHNDNEIPPFQMYPMESFIQSEKFEATLQTQRFQITRATPVSIMNELNFLHDSIKPRTLMAIESSDTPIVCDFMSSHVFEKIPSSSLLSLNQNLIVNSEFEQCASQNNILTDKCENLYSFSSERGLVTNYLYLPLKHTNTEENASITGTCKLFDQSVVNESQSTMDIWNYVWSQSDITDNLSSLNRQTWEHFGEIQSIKEPMFLTDTSVAAIHLEKIRQMNNLPLLSEKIINSVSLLEEIPITEFIKDMKSMLLGLESNSFEYRQATGFALRKNISVYGVAPESLESICQEPIDWGNSYKFLSDLVALKAQNNELFQEGLIFKAMCDNIKELVFYYQTVLLRIFSCENDSDRLLRILQKVRSVASIISKVGKVCEPYKETQNILRGEGSILTRIYNEAIKVTDPKVAVVFYSLLKSCCEIYFRFLQKWIFQGICDDIYGEFMIKTRPQYLRNRSHKFWAHSFRIYNDAVPGFLSDLAESILQCGKTVRLLRTCDSKNPVCHVCVTEPPEIKVCLNADAIEEQSLRCWEYEKKGKSALGSILSLSTAISEQKRLEKKISDVIHTQRDALLKSREKEERENALKIAQAKQNYLVSSQEQILVNDLQEKKKDEEETELTNETLSEVESLETPLEEVNDLQQKKELSNEIIAEIQAEECIIKEKSRDIERTNILNYYENLANDINQRCMRSQWRIKRMKLYEERVDALHTANKDSRDQLIRIEMPGVITSGFPVGNPRQDENRNYTETSLRRFMLDTRTKSRDKIDQLDTTESHSSLISNAHKTISNDNEKHEFQGFPGTLNVGAITEISSTKSTTNTRVNEMFENLSINSTQRSLERPTTLNVLKVDNAKSEIDGMQSLLRCNMTPNNNEPAVIEFTPNANEVTGLTIRIDNATILNQGNTDLETPMSCTTDNFTISSIQSPNSQTYNLENSSPTEISSVIVQSSCSQPMSKSSLTIKRDATFSDIFELAYDEKTSGSTVAPLSINDVEMIDHISLQAYLEKSIRIPLNIQSRLVNNAVIKYFLNENSLLSHLHSLRSYFFLLNGEFAKSLTDSLYARLYEISIPTELFNSATLTNLLERALTHSFSKVHMNSELVSLSATDVPSQLHISDPTALDCLSLNYKIHWPLNIILDEAVMVQYRKVFKFLITSGRVSWVLQEDFNIMKRERKAITSEQYHKLQLYRHSMTQFMNALHNYLTCSVLHASWTEFEKDLEHSLTVDQIYSSHINYVKRILSRCMLNTHGEKVRVCLNSIFKVILQFHNRIRSQNWIKRSTGYVHPNFKKLEQMYKAFCELRTYIAHVAFKLATSGYQPHLMHFLNSLNINHLYDLTVKTSRSSASVSEINNQKEAC
ncbi:gamma-tubulin complex component 6 [Ceratina calcarata]|uniref:Gamma-tubulin complex component 6 n=1 Tax=Ceratina calcarata TaxID=156304 RepID=A0AAJ7ISC8_9HYME|nr:gamma-tubulin complex component 6 [Ceratina calcarata]